MVNPGHPSKGCRTCKLRKIQCDLARPACRYCTKSGRVCLGYEERQIIHSTGWQSISSCPSNIPGDNDTPWNIESSIASISLLKDLLVGTGERNPQERYSFKAMNTKGTNNVAISAISTIRKCLHSLRQTEQSFPNRRALLAEYSTTTSELRATLAVSPYSPALASAAFLFSIYEMMVNIDPKDRTWRIHLHGLLNILLQQAIHHQNWPTNDFDSLRHAIAIYKSEGDAFQALAAYDVNSRAKAPLILDIANLCLQHLASEVEKLFQVKTLRKLDVQKFRASVKHIQKNLNLFPKICPKAELDISKVFASERLTNALLLTRWNDYHCLQLITADLLLSTGKFIHSGNNYEDTRECSIISSLIQEAGESICSAIPVILETMPIQETDQPNDGMEVPIGGFLAFWPLCCALKSPKISQSQQDWIRRTLWSVGLKAFFPHASALANSKAENTKWTDVVAGLLLIRVALSQEMRGLFGNMGY